MRFRTPNGSVQYAEKSARFAKWHLWFAWRPIRISDTEKLWLETVWRKEVRYSDCGTEWVERHYFVPSPTGPTA